MKPNFSGAWDADLQRSKLRGPQPKALLASINHSGEQLAAEMLITRSNGSEERLLFSGRISGEDVTNIVQGVEIRSRLQWVGNELLIESWMNAAGRLAHFLDYWSVSGDGQALMMEHRGDDLAGQVTFLRKLQ